MVLTVCIHCALSAAFQRHAADGIGLCDYSYLSLLPLHSRKDLVNDVYIIKDHRQIV